MSGEQQNQGSQRVAVIIRDNYQFKTHDHILELNFSSS